MYPLAIQDFQKALGAPRKATYKVQPDLDDARKDVQFHALW